MVHRTLSASFTLLALIVFVPAAAVSAQPSHWDWRDHQGYDLVSVPKNQRSCGSCWIFSAVGLVESRCMIEAYKAGITNYEPDFSEQHIMACGTGYFGDFDCQGGYTKDVLTHIRDNGVPMEECYLYTGVDAPCPSSCPDSGGPIELHYPVISVSEERNFWNDTAIMNEIMNNGPVATNMDVYDDFYSYSSGIYEHLSGSIRGGKAVLIIGWGEEQGTPYWIVKNTWGENWGEDGFFRILRNAAHANCKFGEWIWMAAVTPVATSAPVADPTIGLLAQNFPNPFNPLTEIVYRPASRGLITLAVFDAAGRQVRVLANGNHEPGREYRVIWDGRDEEGARLSSGVYYYRLDDVGRRLTRRMVMLK